MKTLLVISVICNLFMLYKLFKCYNIICSIADIVKVMQFDVERVMRWKQQDDILKKNGLSESYRDNFAKRFGDNENG